MKLSFILFFIGTFCIYANTGYAQDTRVNLHLEKASLTDVFREIEKQSDYRFFYNNAIVNTDKKIDLNANNESISTLLGDLFQGTDIHYRMVENYIVITHKNDGMDELLSKAINQGITITGVVIDVAGGPMPGVNVTVKGTITGSVTDVNGKYSIRVPDNHAVLVFSSIGYTTQEIAVGDQREINVTLNEDMHEIEEVVVVGYGTQRKINLTGAVSAISGNELTKRSVVNSTSMIQGLLPGVRVVQGSGQPGANPSIQVRGMGTFSGAGVNPLVLIDGVEGDLNGLDPNTIESVSVLKDAASASIYGSRAANGVILVKTKDGSKTDKINVSYNFNYGIHSPTKMVDLVTNSVDYMNAFNSYIRNSNYGVDIPMAQYPQEEIEKYRNATDRVLYPNFDWVDFIINPAPTQMHNLSINGGNKTHYNLSLGYFNEKGTMEAFYYKRYNAQLNVSSEVNNKLKIGGKAAFKKGVLGSERSGSLNYFLCTTSQAPTYMPTLPDGSGRYTWRAYPWELCNWNPYLKLNEETAKTDDYYATAQAWFDWEIIKGLHWVGKGAANFSTSAYKEFTAKDLAEQLYRSPHGDGYQLASSLYAQNSQSFYTNLQTYFNYSIRLGKHQIDAMAGFSSEDSNNNWIQGARNKYASPTTPELSAGGQSGQTNGGGSQGWSMLSYFGRINYSFYDRYLFEANLRYDGTSRMSPSTRWGAFPSFSLGWRISEENFMESLRPWLNNLKLRASWGILGNQNIGYYPYQAMLSYTGVYPFDNTLSQGVTQTALNNYNIRWEKTTTSNIALDVVMFNKLSLSFEVYKKLTTDILRGAQVNALVGMTAPTINSGSMQNIGYDLNVTYRDRVSDFRYGIGVIVGGFKNKLVKFGAREDGESVLKEEGRPWNTFYVLQVDGIFQTPEEINNSPKQYGENTQPGMLKFKNTNGDNVINNDDRVPMEKGVFPACTYGVTLDATWKGFDLYAFFQGVAGSKVYVTGWGLQPFMQGTAPTKDQLANCWTPENKSNKYVMMGDPVSYLHPSTYLLKNNSYMRLKALQIGYTLPRNWTGKIGLAKARIYFSGDNLLTFTKYDGLDPERAGNGTYLSYPQNKVVSFGCNIEF